MTNSIEINEIINNMNALANGDDLNAMSDFLEGTLDPADYTESPDYGSEAFIKLSDGAVLEVSYSAGVWVAGEIVEELSLQILRKDFDISDVTHGEAELSPENMTNFNSNSGRLHLDFQFYFDFSYKNQNYQATFQSSERTNGMEAYGKIELELYEILDFDAVEFEDLDEEEKEGVEGFLWQRAEREAKELYEDAVQTLFDNYDCEIGIKIEECGEFESESDKLYFVSELQIAYLERKENEKWAHLV